MSEENISQDFRMKNKDEKGITAGSKVYKSINKKKKLKHNKIVLLAKSKLNSVEVLISKDLIDSVISHDEFKIL